MTGFLLAAALSLTPVGEVALPQEWQGRLTTGMSGIARMADDSYYAVRDSKGILYSLSIGIDLATGGITNCLITGMTHLKGMNDTECVVWDKDRKLVWTSDEDDGTIRAFNPMTGEEAAQVDVPKIFDAFRFNFSFESLALDVNGREMWTCNEEALNRRDAVHRIENGAKPVKDDTPDVDDGARSSRKAGSRVRLLRFSRENATSEWKASGQWVYETDPIGGNDFVGRSRSGVADLLLLEDGTLLALEREMSIKKGWFMPSFRCRIYHIDFTGAEDVSHITSLKDVPCRTVKKTRVFGANTGLAMYEGICLGPKLADGSRSVLLISDGDDGAANRIMALKLSK